MDNNYNRYHEGSSSYNQPHYRNDYQQGNQPPYQQPARPYRQPAYQQTAPQQPYQQQIFIQQPPRKNGLGTAGFVLALLALILCWVPGLDFILWILGAIFSIIGLFKSPRGLAIAGTVISFLGIIVLLLFFGAVLGIGSLASLASLQ